jgi:ABC-type Fe3+ transport system substrate-binding protein
MRIRSVRATLPGLLVLVLGLACTPTGGPARGDAAAAPAAPGAGSGAGSSPTTASSASPTAAWDRLLEGAKTDGNLVVAGPTSPEYRARVSEAFARRFGFQMEYIALSAGDASARLDLEATAGRPTMDILIGDSTDAPALLPAGRYDTIRDKLTLPEVVDMTKWLDGRLKYNDPEEQYLLQSVGFIPSDLLVNPTLVQPSSFRSWRDLLRPEYTGKIVAQDPRAPGPGQFTALYLLDVFGPEFVRQLYVGQQVVNTPDRRQAVEWVGRGSYPVGLGLPVRDVEVARKDGLPIERPIPDDGPGGLAGGSGVIKLVKNAPHPNAAIAFVNWFVTKEGQEIFQASNQQPSRRTDVDKSDMPPYILPKPGVQYKDYYSLEWISEGGPRAQEVLRGIFAGR